MENCLPKVLIVDDDLMMLDLLKAGLEIFGGFEVIFANDGQQALELARQESPDVVISDLIMPGVDGEELVYALREEERFLRLPVFILTGTPDIAKALMVGGVEILQKPVDPALLVARIWEALDRARGVKPEVYT